MDEGWYGDLFSIKMVDDVYFPPGYWQLIEPGIQVLFTSDKEFSSVCLELVMKFCNQSIR